MILFSHKKVISHKDTVRKNHEDTSVFQHYCLHLDGDTAAWLSSFLYRIHRSNNGSFESGPNGGIPSKTIDRANTIP